MENLVLHVLAVMGFRKPENLLKKLSKNKASIFYHASSEDE